MTIDLLVRDGCVEVADGLELVFLAEDGEVLVWKLHLPVLETALEQFPAGGGFLELLFLELELNLVAGLGSDHEVEPVGGGTLVLAALDLHDLAGAEPVLDGGGPAVDGGAHAFETQVGVDVEGEVQDRGSLGQPAQLPVRGEDEDVLGEEAGDVLVVVPVVALQDVAHALEPGGQAFLLLDALVGPVVMCRDSYPLLLGLEIQSLSLDVSGWYSSVTME